ncbi:hypothetical protein LOTGIDRAFT_202629 [Lottia gigantea]|uniref:Protein MAK10 homolog n=1 Tax=Lottia gigantea TaxID=225164 RepID=V4BSR0_LOTGI|nr:hypothetical protein LOTGIDRAFT_202629 [Lottia gigantea]ESO92094.1 hypothetical protein LOTGIDRAFT_202629 [Lottia gigantea]
METSIKDSQSTLKSSSVWKDVTDDFMLATSDLQLGELLHDSSFGLFEAMSAIEMMDSKMDAGMMCNQIKRKVLTFEQSIEAGRVKITDVSCEDKLGIIDSTMACLVTWLEGHSLAQTVFTNLYLHNPYIIEDRVLKAFSICMLKIVDIIRMRINIASVFEEEDFQPMSYGFKMAFDLTETRCLGMMKEVEEELNKTLRSTRTKPGEERNEALEKEHNLTLALYTRIKFYRLFYSLLVLLAKEKVVIEGIPQVIKLLSQLDELIQSIQPTIQYGIQPSEREATKNDYPTIMGFEPLINQRLLPPTFPRYTVIKDRDESIVYIKQLIQHLNIVTSLPDVISLHTLIDMFIEFSKSSPCVLARSVLQLAVLPQNRRIYGSHTVIDFMKETIRNFIAPPALSTKCSLYNNSQAKDYVDALLNQGVRPIRNILEITGHNRARQRDKWAHILEELSNLQEEADKVDALLHGILVKTEPSRNHLACFGTWVLYHSLQAMIHYTLAGFELELYATYEYHYVYWYLYELLFAWLVSTLHRADNFLLENDMAADTSQKGRSNKKNKKKKRTKTLSKEINLAQAQQQMFGGYYKALVGFRLDNKLTVPSFEFDCEEVRYSHRFGPFVNVITPPVVYYSQYKEMSDLRRYEPGPTAIDMYDVSCKCFHQAKTLFESIPSPNEEVQSLMRIAKTNFVVMKLLVGGHKKESLVPPEFDFSQHRVYPIIKVI